MKPRLPKPTSGHLDRSFVFGVQRSDDNFATLRCPEVRLGSLGFMLRPLRRAQENQPEKRCQEGPEKVPNPDGSRGGENPGSGGRPDVVPFQLTRYSKNDDSEPRQAPDPSGGFSGGSKTGRPEGRPERAPRRSKRPDPRALVHHIFVLSCPLRFSLVFFVFVSSSW